MTFDVTRATLRDPDMFERFRVIRDAAPMPAGISDNEQLIIFAIGAERRALLVRQMAYHHVAQGELNDQPFLVTF